MSEQTRSSEAAVTNFQQPIRKLAKRLLKVFPKT